MEILPNKFPWPYLTTARLEIRPLQQGDAQALWEVRSAAEVARYQTWSSYTLLDAEVMIDAMRGASLDYFGRWYQLAAATLGDGRLIGDLALRFPAQEGRQAEIGFNIGSKHWRKGYGREMLGRLVAWLSDELGVRRIFAIKDERNHASRKLLSTCGFSPAPGGWRLVFFKGEWAGEMVYERLSEPGALQSPPS